MTAVLPALRKRVQRQVFAWRFKLFQQRRYHQLVLEHINRKPFIVLPEVFNPALFFTSSFFVEQFAQHIPADAHVLDMGTGSGVGAIFAAQSAAQVTALDINPEAVRCTQINALMNRVEGKITIQQSDLFEAIQGQRFDVVLFNPPFYRGTPQTKQDFAWRSEDTVERFAAQLADHLTPDGYALVILSSNSDEPRFMDAFRANHFEISIIAQRDLTSEILTIYKLKP